MALTCRVRSTLTILEIFILVFGWSREVSLTREKTVILRISPAIVVAINGSFYTTAVRSLTTTQHTLHVTLPPIQTTSVNVLCEKMGIPSGHTSSTFGTGSPTKEA